jgi:hypothetical protein
VSGHRSNPVVEQTGRAGFGSANLAARRKREESTGRK